MVPIKVATTPSLEASLLDAGLLEVPLLVEFETGPLASHSQMAVLGSMQVATTFPVEFLHCLVVQLSMNLTHSGLASCGRATIPDSTWQNAKPLAHEKVSLFAERLAQGCLMAVQKAESLTVLFEYRHSQDAITPLQEFFCGDPPKELLQDAVQASTNDPQSADTAVNATAARVAIEMNFIVTIRLVLLFFCEIKN